MTVDRRFLLPFVLCGCYAFARAELRTDIEYARRGGETLALDASIPEGKGPFPTAIIVHGGAWRGGDKQFSGVKPLFEPLTKAGYAWFTINYRLAPKRRDPAAETAPGAGRIDFLALQVDDVETAVRWVKDHAGDYRVDTKKIVLIGESAGAHLIAMVATRNMPGTSVAAVAPFYGPFDMEAMAAAVAKSAPGGAARVFADLVGAVGMDEDAYLARIREDSPICHVRKGIPPFLLIHGTADKTVPYAESVNMCRKIKSVGGECELFVVEGADHGIGKWEADVAFQAYKAKLIEWLGARLKTK